MTDSGRPGLGYVAAGVAATIATANHAWQWLQFVSGDLGGPHFFSFYAATRLFLERGGSHLYDARLQAQYQGQAAAIWHTPFNFLPYIHPPYYTLLIAPLGLLSFRTAYLVMAAANAALVVAAALVLAHANRWGRAGTGLAAVVALAFLPVFITIIQGQSDLLVVLMLALAYHAWTRNREGLAGVFAGLAAMKPQMMLLVPLLFLARRTWRAVAGFAAGAGALVLVSLPFFGINGWLDYLRVIVPWAVGGHQDLAITRQTAYSLRGLLEAAPGGRPVALAILALVILLAFAVLSWRAPRSSLDLGYAVAGSVVLSPYQNFHDLALLLIPGFAVAALAQRKELRHPRLGWLVMALGFVAINLVFVTTATVAAVAALTLALYIAAERLATGPEPLLLGEVQWSGPRPRRVVVLPAYYAEKTVRDVVAQIPRDEVDRILLVDDASSDRTAEVALELGIDVIKHPRNLGYGGNQKTCYANALLMGAEVVVMLHPDGQYDPALVPALCQAIEQGKGDVALGSRWLNLDPARAGMPWWKRLGNRFLTRLENLVLGLRLSEYHTGYRAYSRRFLETVPYALNADDFVFDTQVLVQAASFGFTITEIPAVGRYFDDMSSIGLRTSTVYGLKTLAALAAYLGHRAGLPCRWLEGQPALVGAAAPSGS